MNDTKLEQTIIQAISPGWINQSFLSFSSCTQNKRDAELWYIPIFIMIGITDMKLVIRFDYVRLLDQDVC